MPGSCTTIISETEITRYLQTSPRVTLSYVNIPSLFHAEWCVEVLKTTRCVPDYSVPENAHSHQPWKLQCRAWCIYTQRNTILYIPALYYLPKLASTQCATQDSMSNEFDTCTCTLTLTVGFILSLSCPTRCWHY